ncbi:nucleoside-diphosphate kinase [Candidatus Pacearchaeota archaeon CG09_land_8_20_14_0_10_30_9]|nr:nucleoside-diphosphate kinase [Candidatus Pacearchaeota archaeon]OIO40555.1 MAG: nucleoside-diphosphate kinase [Candidatus Pacearchaeota archaeon CG1_02_30_18]PIN71549.1 MAG: nucleoside-diphosphate kinase [Candidatus Pacearchaeota archaeon CG11_big_fil_rev_8_21_14_0_20_30_13]PIO01493.1 MAG: nucleoside-diphosphate kinase [Candidatus Pacearchaeota archaeon CG09_land_8_20_14_0_10_30_9]PIZ81747.1 MAG: nucleoside-diphosphate kinase [Candidatus Pacearchaeota archaeon CG_4_10_14_0_2_um_filter_30_11
MERTLVLIKPDGVMRNLVGKIISRFEDAGLKIIGMKMIWTDEEFARKHYRDDLDVRYKEVFKKYGKSVRNELVKYLKEGPVIAFVLEGVDAINVTRKITGGTYPNESLPGTIRGDFAHISKNYANSKDILVRNLIHASGNKEDAEIEVPLWFNQKELHSYKTVHDLICLC